MRRAHSRVPRILPPRLYLADLPPEVNLNHSNGMSKEELARRSGLSGSETEQKPLLMQLLEGFLSGDKSAAGPAQAPTSANQAPARKNDAAPNVSSLLEQSRVEKESHPSVQQPPKKREDLIQDDKASKRSGSPDFFSGHSANQRNAGNAGSKKQ